MTFGWMKRIAWNKVIRKYYMRIVQIYLKKLNVGSFEIIA